ncbi:MAG: hypothetical protein WBY71_11615 [Nitrososphaeraceae archaeon]
MSDAERVDVRETGKYAILSGLVKIKHTSPNLLEKNWALAEADGTGKVFVPCAKLALQQ